MSNSSLGGHSSSRGGAASAFAAAAAKAVALAAAGVEGALPLLSHGAPGFSNSNMLPSEVRNSLSSRDGPGTSRYAPPTARSSFGSNAGARSSSLQGVTRIALADSEKSTPRLLF